jgi:hypothetical protein
MQGFSDLPFCAKYISKTSAAICERIPYAAEQGIYSGKQGINSAFSTGAGNLARSRFLRAM